MTLKIDINEKHQDILESADFRYSEPRDKLNGSALENSFERFEVLTEILMADFKPVSTENKNEHRFELMLISILGLVWLPKIRCNCQSKWCCHQILPCNCETFAGQLDKRHQTTSYRDTWVRIVGEVIMNNTFWKFPSIEVLIQSSRQNSWQWKSTW